MRTVSMRRLTVGAVAAGLVLTGCGTTAEGGSASGGAEDGPISGLRVMVPNSCRVSRNSIERHAQRPFALPGDLEKIMPSFKGRFIVTSAEARWELYSRKGML